FNTFSREHLAVSLQVNALIVDDDAVEVEEDCLNHWVVCEFSFSLLPFGERPRTGCCAAATACRLGRGAHFGFPAQALTHPSARDIHIFALTSGRPEGLPESSRWSERSEDHRYR